MDLVESFNSLHHRAEYRLSGLPKEMKPVLEKHLIRCKNHVDDLYQTICHRLQAETFTTRQLACGAKMWPCMSTTSLLQHLARGKVALLRDDWKYCLIGYGVAISKLQRAERLFTYMTRNC